MTKRVLLLALALVLAFSMLCFSTLVTLAAGDSISVYLDGRPLAFDVPPQIINDRTMVPLRAVFEAFGAAVEWDGATQAVTGTKGDTVVVLTIGSTSPSINGKLVTIDQPGVIVNDRTLAPLRFVGEAFGGKVDWDGATNTVTITSGAGTVAPEITPESTLEPVLGNPFSLSVAPYDKTAFLNGEPHEMKRMPILLDNALYLPVEDIVVLLGGTYSKNGNKFKASNNGYSVEYEEGDSTSKRYGHDESDEQIFRISDNGGYAPIINDGAFFAQPHWFTSCSGIISVSEARVSEDTNFAVLSNYRIEKLISHDYPGEPVILETLIQYESLPDAFRTTMTSLGMVDFIEGLNYDIERFNSHDVDVYVLRLREGARDTEGLNGAICAVRARTNMFSTLCGLQVGDYITRVVRLYEASNIDWMHITIDHGRFVSTITLWTRYYDIS